MSSVVLDPFVASLVAGAASLLDLFVNREKGLYWSAAALCSLYVLFDVVAALLLFVIFGHGADLLKDNPTVASAVVAGLVAALLMRTKIKVPFMKGSHGVNAVLMLRRLQLGVAVEIADHCAIAETAWILDKVLPSMSHLSLAEVEEWALESVSVTYRDSKARDARSEWVDKVRAAANDSADEEDRKHLIVQILLDCCTRRAVTRLVKRSKKKYRQTRKSSAASNKVKLLRRLRRRSAVLQLGSDGNGPGIADQNKSTVDGPDSSEMMPNGPRD